MEGTAQKDGRRGVGKGAFKKDSQNRRYPLRNRSPESSGEPGELRDDGMARPFADDGTPRQDGRFVNRRRNHTSSPKKGGEQGDGQVEVLREPPRHGGSQSGGAAVAAAAGTARLGPAEQPGITDRAVAEHMARLKQLEELCEGLRNTQVNINAERIRFNERLEVQEDRTEELDLRQTETEQVVGRLERNYTDVNRQAEINFNAVRRLTDSQLEITESVRNVRRDLAVLADRRPQQPQGINYNRPVLNVKLPVFHARDTDKPLQFLSAINKYFQAVDPNGNDLHLILDQALQGTSQEWWSYVEGTVRTIDDFSQRFRERYWNDAAQDRVRRELYDGIYLADMNISMADYALQVYNRARYLDNGPIEASIVKSLRMHFDRDTQRALTCRQIDTIADLIKILEDLDQVGPINLARDPSRSSNQPRNNGKSTAPPQTNQRNQPNTQGNQSRHYNQNWRTDNRSNDSGYGRSSDRRGYNDRGYYGTNSNQDQNAPHQDATPSRQAGGNQGAGGQQPRRDTTPTRFSTGNQSSANQRGPPRDSGVNMVDAEKEEEVPMSENYQRL